MEGEEGKFRREREKGVRGRKNQEEREGRVRKERGGH